MQRILTVATGRAQLGCSQLPVMALGLLLCFSSPAAAQTASCASIADATKISEVGAFSDRRHTAEHEYGYTVMLWSAGNCVFGLFESAQGLAGDTPIGELQDLKYDRKTGLLSFSAKLTTGMVSVRGSSGLEPARDLFAFKGRLQSRTVKGVITHRLQGNPNVKATGTDVVLGASAAQAEFMHGAATYGEWRRTWQPILERRGPKW